MRTLKETLKTILLCASLVLVSNLIQANSDEMNTMEEVITEKESITIPLSQKPNSAIKRPKRGQSKEQVRSEFGSPKTDIPARGKPPISKWIYQDFTVIFESDYVIHSVVNNR